MGRSGRGASFNADCDEYAEQQHELDRQRQPDNPGVGAAASKPVAGVLLGVVGGAALVLAVILFVAATSPCVWSPAVTLRAP